MENKSTEIKLQLIGYAPEHNLFRSIARSKGAYVITNYKTNRKEVYAISEKADDIKRQLYPSLNLYENNGKYYFITPENIMEITMFEFNQLKQKLEQNAKSI